MTYKPPRHLVSLGAILALYSLLAATLATPASAVTISWVPVGNPGNANDSTGYGGVAYNYSIDKYDVTVGQYTEFLNAVAKTDTYGLYYGLMGIDLNIRGISRGGSSGSYTYNVIGSSANLPITYVSWGDAARFSNWLQNGQPNGDEGPGTTETGAYTLNGAISDAALSAVTRNPGATVFIPSESEWYKAAYYSPTLNSGAGGYYQYPFSSNTVPTSAVPGSTPNTGNFMSPSGAFAVTGSTSYSSSQNYLTAVGAYTASASPYGAYDMGDDVFQWNEALSFGLYRGQRGGSWDFNSLYLQSSVANSVPSTVNSRAVGFRVASVPEPGTAVLAGLGLLGLGSVARRKKVRRA
jgi:formylglycine-generating enzyme required for sulfatase activity